MDLKNTFSTQYLAPIDSYSHLIQNEIILIDEFENFVKQSYRNRCCILSPNGVQNLTVPLIKSRKKKRTKEVKISYDENWRKLHWKSLEAAYRSSPYFEFYEDDFHPFYHGEKFTYLVDLNEELQQKVIDLLAVNLVITKSDAYIQEEMIKVDFRNTFSPKQPTRLQFPTYIQVFGERNGFAPNMSIVDLLFNEGPNAVNYMQGLEKHV